MSEQNTNFNTKQDKVTTGQEVTKSDLIKKNAPDNSLASVLLAAAFYSAIVYLAMFCLNPWGILLMIFQAPSLICYIIATILVWNFLSTSIGFYIVSILLANEAFRYIPIMLTILVIVGTVMYKQDNEQDNK